MVKWIFGGNDVVVAGGGWNLRLRASMILLRILNSESSVVGKHTKVYTSLWVGWKNQ